MEITIGYEKQYEDFKNTHSGINGYKFNANGYTAQYYMTKWRGHEYKPKDSNERFIITKEVHNDINTEEIIGTYDTFEEAYKTATSLGCNTLYIHAYCVNIVFSNKNIEFRKSIIFIEKYARIPLDNYSYSKIDFETNMINKDNFNYQFFDKIGPLCKILMHRYIEDDYIKNYMIQNILDNIKTEDNYGVKRICNELLSHDSIDPKILFSYVYQKDVPLKKQYDLIDGCFSANRYVNCSFITDSLIEDEKIRDILEECYINTRMHHYKARYVAKNYERLSKKYNVSIYELLKYGVNYNYIEGLESKIKNEIVLYGISKCINMSGNNCVDSMDFLFYAIDKTKKRDLNKSTLELLSQLIIEKLIDYSYTGRNICMTNEANFQLIADKTIEELLKTKKNKTVFVKKVMSKNKEYNTTLFSKCLLNSIYSSDDKRIKKALVKIGVEGK